MGCGSSKIDDLPLVTLCRERRDFARAAADERYALAVAHVSYFRSLVAVGDALCKFVDEELVFGSNSGSSPGSSPVLTLPSDEGKRGKNREGKGKGKHRVSSSSSTSISHSLMRDLHENGDNGGSHLNLSDSESEFSSGSGHIHLHDDSSSKGEAGVGRDDDDGVGPSGYGYDYGDYGTSYLNQDAPDQYGRPSDQYQNPPYQGYGYSQGEGYGYSQGEGNGYSQGDWDGWNRGSEFMGPQARMYFMKGAPTPAKSVVFGEPERYQVTEDGGTGYGYSGYSGNGNMNGGFFSYPTMGTRDTGIGIDREQSSQQQQQKPPPSPPLPPSISTWDYFNVFETYNDGHMSYFPKGSVYGSTTSSPDSKEVREREGIPELEDETESETMRVMYNERKKLGRPMNSKEVREREGIPELEDETESETMRRVMYNERKKLGRPMNLGQKFGEGTSKAVPLTKSRGVSPMMSPPKDEESINSVPSLDSDSGEMMTHKEKKSSASDTVVPKSPMEEHPKKKEVRFEVEEIARVDVDSPILGSLAPLSARGTRDVQEVVREIRHEFETASEYGKEVAMLLEVGKLPYQSRGTFLKVMFSRIIYLVAPSILSSYPSSRSTVRVSAQKMKAAALYFGDTSKDFNIRSLNISSTLGKLYVWEKKLYKEVKDEERLRVAYQEKCKKLKILDDRGAEATKIDATQASIRKLLTKINVCVKTVNVISTRIHRLRDEELQPQLNKLISGLIRMWRSMLRCHQKQLQAIMESKVRVLKGNIDFRRESSLRATVELETELVNWCNCFSEWIKAQKSYVSSLNGWLLRCINHEPEDTADGPAPFSPSRMGAPAIFVICNDWYQAMERISGRRVSKTMRDFALRLHQLWERQDEEQRQRTRAEHVSKDFEKQLRFLRMEKGKMEVDEDALSERTAVSKYASESGVSHLDDLKNDLDSMRKKLEEERTRHKEAMNLVRDTASNSLQAGLVPIFESLGSFTSEVLRGYEEVRLQGV